MSQARFAGWKSTVQISCVGKKPGWLGKLFTGIKQKPD
jgi:hypothetical protein